MKAQYAIPDPVAGHTQYFFQFAYGESARHLFLIISVSMTIDDDVRPIFFRNDIRRISDTGGFRVSVMRIGSCDRNHPFP